MQRLLQEMDAISDVKFGVQKWGKLSPCLAEAFDRSVGSV
jgi:hypothetical protein